MAHIQIRLSVDSQLAKVRVCRFPGIFLSVFKHDITKTGVYDFVYLIVGRLYIQLMLVIVIYTLRAILGCVYIEILVICCMRIGYSFQRTGKLSL